MFAITVNKSADVFFMDIRKEAESLQKGLFLLSVFLEFAIVTQQPRKRYVLYGCEPDKSMYDIKYLDMR